MYENIGKSTKQFILTAVGLAIAVWNFSFNLGAYKTIFFDQLFLIWVVCTVVLLTFILLPNIDKPIRWPGVGAMILPTVWLVVSTMSHNFEQVTIFDQIEIGLVILITLFCLPYIAYVLISVLQSEVMSIRPPKLLAALIAIALFIGFVSFFIGANNYLFLTCQDFKISGSDLPLNCREVTTTTDTNGRMTLESGIWQLSSINGEDALSGSEITAVFNSNESSINGNSGCNNYFATYEASEGSLSISAIGSTRMACVDPDGVMQQESRYLMLLSTVSAYRIDNNSLSMTDSNGEQIFRFILNSK